MGHSAALRGWCEAHPLSDAQFVRLMEEQTRVRWIEEAAQTAVLDHLRDHLRVSGEYVALDERSREKQRRLETWGLENPALADAGLTEGELLDWYFRQRLGRDSVPDVGSYAAAAGFADEAAFHLAVLREYCYCHAPRREHGR